VPDAVEIVAMASHDAGYSRIVELEVRRRELMAP
jgi:hypothetical protein